MEHLEIRRVGVEGIDLYAEVPESFIRESVLRVEPINGGHGGTPNQQELVAIEYHT